MREALENKEGDPLVFPLSDASMAALGRMVCQVRGVDLRIVDLCALEVLPHFHHHALGHMCRIELTGLRR